MDYDGLSGDYSMHWAHWDVELEAGESASYGFLIAVGEDIDIATAAYEEQAEILCTE